MKKYYTQLILIIIMVTLSESVTAQKAEVITQKPIFSSMAGEGDPWEILSDDLEKILLALHKGFTVSEIAKACEIEKNNLINQLEILVRSNMVTKTKGNYYPDILIATEEEALHVYQRAKVSAGKISQRAMRNWPEIEKSFKKLEISQRYSLEELGFMLVGSRILDVGVLRELANSEVLLLPAPLRPTPSYPNSKYYLWIEESSPDTFRYGQKDIQLKFENWYIVDFGRDNESRDKLEAKVGALIESGDYDSPEDCADLLRVPCLNKEDSNLWENFVTEISTLFLKDLLEEKEEIKDLYKTLRTSQYSDNTFDDFYCWYYHYLYPIAINNLIAKNLFDMPSNRHTTIILFNQAGTGVHFE